jgi:hypothetical protein
VTQFSMLFSLFINSDFIKEYVRKSRHFHHSITNNTHTRGQGRRPLGVIPSYAWDATVQLWGVGHKLIFFVIGQDQPKNGNSSIRSRGGESEMFKVTSRGLLGLG